MILSHSPFSEQYSRLFILPYLSSDRETRERCELRETHLIIPWSDQESRLCCVCRTRAAYRDKVRVPIREEEKDANDVEREQKKSVANAISARRAARGERMSDCEKEDLQRDWCFTLGIPLSKTCTFRFAYSHLRKVDWGFDFFLIILSFAKVIWSIQLFEWGMISSNYVRLRSNDCWPSINALVVSWARLPILLVVIFLLV